MEYLAQITKIHSSPELIKKLYEYSILKIYPPGSCILNEHAYIRSIPIVIRGVMKVIRSEEDGREILLYYIEAGESCIMSVLGGLHNQRSKVRVEVEEEAEILFLPLERVSEFMREYPEWLSYIFRSYHKRFEELLKMINAIAFRRIDERLLDLLMKKQQLAQSSTLHITHEQLAVELGTARTVVSRLLKQLEEAGTLSLGRNRITLM